MNRFTAIADSFLDRNGTLNINEKLNSFVKEKGYNLNEHQRLVEEINIAIFLRKLKNNTQHEDYEMAEPVIAEVIEPVKIEDLSPLKKVASYGNCPTNNILITPDMFDIQKSDSLLDNTSSIYFDSSNSDNFLNKTAMELNEFEIQSEKEILLEKQAYEKELNNISNIVADEMKNLIKIANTDPSEAKSIIFELSSANLKKYAEEVAIECKHNTKDIVNSKMKPLSKEASGALSHIGQGIKSIGKIPYNAAKAAYHIGTAAVKRPKTAAVIGLGAYGIHKNPETVDNLREAMSLNNRS